MTAEERRTWERKYRENDLHLPSEPTDVLRDRIAAFPDGRALDVATGLGRNARFLADHGYEVDAIDISREALTRARSLAGDEAIHWIQGDVDEYCFPTDTYAVVVVSYYRTTERLTDLVDALVPGGILVYEHPVRSPDTPSSASTHAFAPNQLLRLFRSRRDVYVIHYEETWLDATERPRAVLVAQRRRE